MIAEIRLENFKRFRDLSLNAANLTVLTGANGAGKTSVLHSLLLARQMARQPDRSHVELNGVDTLELGGPEDVIHREASDDLAAIEVLDAEGTRRRWSFRATSTTDTRTLNAAVVDRPDGYSGALAGPARQFSYLCAERLGPRDVLGASAADVAELDVGPRGEFVAQVLASFNRSRIRTGRLASSTTETQISSLLHQTESWMGEIVHPIQIDAEWFPDTSVTRLRFKTPGLRTEWTRAPNAGFGISYALPIVVAALRAEVGGLLLVENPEAHLHPAGQSRIGGFLARSAFPALDWADGVWRGLGHFSRPYIEVRDELVRYLGGLSDHGAACFHEHRADPRRLSRVLSARVGSETSDENGRTKGHPPSRRDRTRRHRGIDKVFWWHVKLRPHVDRIHFLYEPPSVSAPWPEHGRIVVGLFKDHCILPN